MCSYVTGCSLFQEQYDYPDFDGDILSSYTSAMDFTGLLSKENPIESVNTRSSILYKNDHQRQMYVFSTPVREYVDNQYGVYDLTLYPPVSAETGVFLCKKANRNFFSLMSGNPDGKIKEDSENIVNCAIFPVNCPVTTANFHDTINTAQNPTCARIVFNYAVMVFLRRI